MWKSIQIGLLILGFCHQAGADIYNPAIFPIGEKAAFLANTGTGDPTDTSAVYYNPAGLTELDKNKISLTGSTYFLFKIKYDAAFVIDNQDIPYEVSGFNTIPSTMVSTMKLFGTTLAFSVLVPNGVNVETQQDFDTGSTSGRFAPVSNERELRVGFSGARRLDPKWSVGATLWGIYYSNSELTATDFTFGDGSTVVVSDYAKTQINHYSVAATLAALYRPRNKLGVGLRLQTPNVEVAGEAKYLKVNQLINLADTGNEISKTVTEKKSTPADYKLPTDITLGFAWGSLQGFRWLLDVSVQMTADYRVTEEIEGSKKIKTKPTPRLNTGFEWKLTDNMPVRLGFQYVPSTIDNKDENSLLAATYDLFGVSGGIFMESSEHSRTGIGGFFLTGEGKVRNEVTDNSRVTVQGMGLLLTSSYIF